jgi:formylglycine-generating enzyme required for sulfatase activity
MSKYRPAWASGWGEDRYGEWLALTLGEATQRMRWIRPGRFLMGSPQDEPGRFGKGDREPGRFGSSQFEFRYEGPRHEVRLSRGYWLFDTPVTQALWVAVMGSNPSRFVDPKRPVERVSWDDAIEFLARINARIPDLDLVLPTEAQWEYGCRAGTETATYAGPLEILGLRNAPILDAIAWYGGNSGVGFELENGHDSWGWREQQYWHNRAGTHPVALKRPNAWGLYDMLGNVWEWCADDLRKYGSDAVNDPVGSLDSTERGLRGGSWNDYADAVCAASRDANERVDRYDDLGFRCARVRP